MNLNGIYIEGLVETKEPNRFYQTMLESRVKTTPETSESLSLEEIDPENSLDSYIAFNQGKRQGLLSQPSEVTTYTTEKDKEILSLKEEITVLQARLKVARQNERLAEKQAEKILARLERQEAINTEQLFRSLRLQDELNRKEFQVEKAYREIQKLKTDMEKSTLNLKTNRFDQVFGFIKYVNNQDNETFDIVDWNSATGLVPCDNGFYQVSDGVHYQLGYFSKSKSKFFVFGKPLSVRYWRST